VHEHTAPVIFAVPFGRGLCGGDFGYIPIGANVECSVKLSIMLMNRIVLATAHYLFISSLVLSLEVRRTYY